MTEPVQTYDKAVLTLYVGGEATVTLTFERDEYDHGAVLVSAADDDRDVYDANRLRRVGQYVLNPRPAFRVEVGKVTIQYLEPNQDSV